MNPLSFLWDRYVSWRHSKGYGVHSPFAYRLVTDVISPGEYGYYGYHQIDRTCRNKMINPDRMKFLLRLVVFLKSKRLVFTSGMQQGYKAVAFSAAIPLVRVKDISSFKFMEGDLLVCDGDVTGPHSLEQAIGKGVNIIAFNPTEEMCRILEEPLEYGLLLKGRNLILLATNKDMAYTVYSMRFGRL